VILWILWALLGNLHWTELCRWRQRWMLWISGGLEELSCMQRCWKEWGRTRRMWFNVTVGLRSRKAGGLFRAGWRHPFVTTPSPQWFARVSHSVAVSVNVSRSTFIYRWRMSGQAERLLVNTDCGPQQGTCSAPEMPQSRVPWRGTRML